MQVGKPLSRMLLMLLLGSLLIVSFWVLKSPTTKSFDADTKVTPAFTVAPNLLYIGDSPSVYLCIWNGDVSTQEQNVKELQTNDTFVWTFDKEYFTVGTFDLPFVVMSKTLPPDDFEAKILADTNQLVVTYKGINKPFPTGDWLYLKVNLITAAKVGPALIALQNGSNSTGTIEWYNNPRFQVISVIEPKGIQGPPGPKGDPGRNCQGQECRGYPE